MFFSSRENEPTMEIRIPSTSPTPQDHYWVVGCYDARDGNFQELNFIFDVVPDYPSLCV